MYRTTIVFLIDDSKLYEESFVCCVVQVIPIDEIERSCPVFSEATKKRTTDWVSLRVIKVWKSQTL